MSPKKNPPAEEEAVELKPKDDGDKSAPVYPRYEMDAGVGITRVSLRKDEEIKEVLADFSAQVLTDELIDNGDELSTENGRVFVMDVHGPSQRATVTVDGDQLSAVGRWTTQAIGVEATIAPGKERMVEHAVRVLSRDNVIRRTRFTSTGWRPGEPPFFVHRGGVVGQLEDDFVVDILGVDDESVYVLAPYADERLAIVESLGLLRMGDDAVMGPLLLTVYRAAIPIPVRHSVVVFGPTGLFKTAAALVLLSHAGAGVSERHLGSWNSTTNYLARTLYHLAGLPAVVDDMAPDGDRHRRLAVQEQLFRAVGNQSGRGRMRSDTTLRETYRPRAALISTGEDTPTFHTSILARLLALPVSSGSIDKSELTQAQVTAREGVYCGALHAWVTWLTTRHEHVRGVFADELQARRQTNGVHARFADMEAELRATARLLIEFAVDRRALTKSEGRKVLAALLGSVADAIALHEQLTKHSDPIEQLFEALLGGLVGGRCHIADENGRPPAEPETWGWRRSGLTDYVGAGALLGYVHGGRLLLVPKPTMRFVNELFVATGQGGFPISEQMVGKLLHERGFSLVDEGHYTSKRRLAGRRPRVWDVSVALFTGEDDEDEVE